MPHRPTLDKQWTVLELIRWGTDYFRQKGIESPRLTIELLLCDVLNTKRINLYSEFERPLIKDELAALRERVSRRAHHEPIQYITGKAEFYSLSFRVTPDVLIPRPETEHLVEHVIRWARGQKRPALTGLDIGTGSGCIPITCCHHVPTLTWVAIDRSEHALEIASENARTHHVDGSIKWVLQNVLEDTPQGQFDLITMNPPYIPKADVPQLDEEVRDFEPHVALTDDADGLTFYRRLAAISPEILATGGLIACELGWGQADRVQALWPDSWKTWVIDDLSGIPRVLLVERQAVTNQ